MNLNDSRERKEKKPKKTTNKTKQKVKCHLLVLPGSEPSHGLTAPVASRPACPLPGAAVSPRSLSLLFAVCTVGQEQRADLLQRDAELPWRERVPAASTAHTRLRGQPCPPCSPFGSPPASRPGHAADGEQ